jgi:hypothetical protein
MFQPPNPTSDERENEEPQSYYMAPPPPQIFQKESEFLENVSKQTLILVFAAFFVGILLGKSMTPVVLRQ